MLYFKIETTPAKINGFGDRGIKKRTSLVGCDMEHLSHYVSIFLIFSITFMFP